MIVLNLLCISVICVYMTDIAIIPTHIIDKLLSWIFKVPKSAINNRERIKPFECTLCQVWWLGLLYIILSGNLSILNIALVAIFSTFASEILTIINWIKDLIDRKLNT